MAFLTAFERAELIGGGIFILVASLVVGVFGPYGLPLYAAVLAVYIVSLHDRTNFD